MEKQENIKKTEESKQVNSSESSDGTIWFRAHVENVGWSGWCCTEMSSDELRMYLDQRVGNISDLVFADRDLGEQLDAQKMARSMYEQVYKGWVADLAKARDDFYLANWDFEKVPKESKNPWEHKRRKRPWEK